MRLIKDAGLVLFGILVAVTFGEGFLTWIDYRYSPLKIKAVKSSDDWRFYHALRIRISSTILILYGVLGGEFHRLMAKIIYQHIKGCCNT